jgi:hypothetical protein
VASSKSPPLSGWEKTNKQTNKNSREGSLGIKEFAVSNRCPGKALLAR